MRGLMSYRRFRRARSLCSDRTPARARSLRSDQPERTFGRYVATELYVFGRRVTILLELLSDDSCFFRKAFRKEESILKKYLSKKFSTFFLLQGFGR
ncbi:hypothetical protein F2Q69_00037251 [Brassica cretica]|uniref:Uncharacterized protein n=1 Tax=Brassica cretica TaxID=69181 RepID=A0A8S9SLX2_BRACR|nr:hypothetical protein F2Q69_00037251 [Brassica cretica]